MSREPVAPRLAGGIGALGGGFMISRYSKAISDEDGFTSPWTSYFAGRCGVLGEVDADVVLAAAFFHNPETVRSAWAERRAAGLAPEVGAKRYRQACLAWGRARLEGFAEAARLADLLEPLIDAADPQVAPIFAGWRALPRPEPGDDLARVALAAHLMREHRMAMHTVAVRAQQMRPLDAILTGVGGEANAAFFGWPPPYPDVSDLAAARTAVEDLTNTLTEPIFAPLTDPEAADLVTLVNSATDTALRR